MANTKDVYIEAIIPYDWSRNLTDEEARVWAAWALAPTGLTVRHTPGGVIPVGTGRLTLYVVVVSGTEAVKIGVLEMMVESLRRQRHAVIIQAEYDDLDDGGVACRIGPEPEGG